MEKRWKCKKLKDAGVILLRAWLNIFSVHSALVPLPLSKGLLYIFLLRVWTHEKRFTTEVNKAKMYIPGNNKSSRKSSTGLSILCALYLLIIFLRMVVLIVIVNIHVFSLASILRFWLPCLFLANFRGNMMQCYHKPCDNLETLLTIDNINFLGKTADVTVMTIHKLSEPTSGKLWRYTHL